MRRSSGKKAIWLVVATFVVAVTASSQKHDDGIGREVAIPRHMATGEEFPTPLHQLIRFGARLFTAQFTVQEGAGRPLTKGTGATVADPSSPLVFPRNFDRISSPEANSCQGCHNAPIAGGGGDPVTAEFVLPQRFDHLTFDHTDGVTSRGALDESGKFVTLDNATNDRKTIGMSGSGFLEMVARQMTADLQATAAATPPGTTRPLTTKGVSFGIITHNGDGTWKHTQVAGLPAPHLKTTGTTPPSLIILPYHQAGAVVSIRQFTNNAMNHHHGMQSEERFGLNTDPDCDGDTNELTVADLTAISMFQATMSVPGLVIPDDPAIAQGIFNGERRFY